MNPSLCEQRDDFLDGTLSIQERAAFLQHLEECETCSQIVQEQERIQQLLRRAVTELEAVPDGMATRLGLRIQRDARQRFMRRVVSLAAALVLIGVGLWWFYQPSPPQIADKVPPAPPPTTPLEMETYVEFRSPVLTVPMKSKSPNVTIVWVYPVVEKSSSPRTDEPSLSERNEP